MSNRLKFYREQMAAFEGTVDPQRAIDSGYYIPEPRKSSSSLITRVALRPSATHLLIGGIGSGKTTQLLVACKQLNEVEGIYAKYVDISLYTDISKISTSVLTVISGIVLSQLTKNSDDEKVQQYRDVIRKKAYGYSEYVPAKNLVDLAVSFSSKPLSSVLLPSISSSTPKIVKHKGVLAKDEDKSDEYQLHIAINYLKKIVQSSHGEVIFLFDGLDRLDDAQLFSRIVTTDIQTISSFGIGLVLVGPLLAAYSQYRDLIEPAVNYTSYQICFDLENDLDARTFFEEILTVRSQGDFINQSSLESLVNFSGGVLRDLINLTQSSIEEAYISDQDSLQEDHVEVAASAFGRAKLLGVSDLDLEVLKKVSETGDFVPRTDDDLRLLVTGRILEYQYPSRRFAVHPTIQPLI